MENPERSQTSILMGAIGFTDEDLEANRRGKLSSEQARDLRHDAGRHLDLIPVAVVGGVISVGVLISNGINQGDSTLTIFGNVAVVGVVAALFIGFAWLWRGSELLAIDRNIADVVEGQVYREASPSPRGSSAYYLRVGGLTFTVSLTTFDCFEDGDYCRLYYAPVTKKILSVEFPADEPRELKISPLTETSEIAWNAIWNPARRHRR